MPSSISFASTTITTSPTRSAARQKMSVTQTYMVAHQARQKLAKEANCADHNLHRLVCHANMLDTLIFDLAHAEDEQESYLNRLAHGPQHKQQPKADKYASVVMEKLQEESESDEEEAADSDSDSDSDDEEYQHWENKSSRTTDDLAAVMIASEEDADELQEECARLNLERIESHHESQPSKSSKTAKLVSKSR